MALTPEQIQSINDLIIQKSNPYLGMKLDGNTTLPLINEVRESLEKEYIHVKVHLSYVAETGNTSVEALVEGTKVSVVFTHSS